MRCSTSLLLLLPLPALLSCAASTGAKEEEDQFNDTFDDGDGDGYFGEEDCQDADPSVHPGAVELCDGIDNNCDGVVDEGVQSEWYADEDDDGFGDPDSTLDACEQPEDYASNGNDCDDQAELVYPGAVEICDGLDNDCDGEVDDDEAAPWYADADGDGYGDPEEMLESCTPPEGHVANAEDCDDAAPESYPGAEEVCDEADNDCDGDVDEGVGSTWYEDRDEDDYGIGDSAVEACSRPAGYASEAGDCDDADERYHPGADESDCADPEDYNCDGSVGYADADGDSWAACEECDDSEAAVNPDATEVCNGFDDDCDRYADDLDPDLDRSTTTAWHEDDDSDGYGDPDDVERACAAPAGTVADGTDCEDGEAAVHPGAEEVCNLIDDDCDSLIDDEDDSLDPSSGTRWYRDADGDGHGDPGDGLEACGAPAGYVAAGDDCDDGDAARSPSAREVCNGIDDDCDSLTDDADSSLSLTTASIWYSDGDGDGYGDPASGERSCLAPAGAVSNDDDCDDSSASISPAATELCNDIDDDCDGLIDDSDLSLSLASTTDWYADDDGDGYGDPEEGSRSCDAPAGTVGNDDDCDDSRRAVSPAADEVCNDIDDDCDGLRDDADSSLESASASTWHRDSDGDGYGAGIATLSCDAPSGYVASDEDCDDASAAVSPDADEVCNDIDDDCDLLTDDLDPSLDPSTTSTWYRDADSDGWGDPSTSTGSCDAPSGSISRAGDCDDSEALAWSGASEACDEVDNDCDGDIDERVCLDVSNVSESLLDRASLSATAATSGIIQTETGFITGLRGAGTGLVDGIWFEVVAQSGGPDLGVFVFDGLTINSGVTLSVLGDNGLVILSADDVSIEGSVVADGADGSTAFTTGGPNSGGGGLGGAGDGGSGSTNAYSGTTAGSGSGGGAVPSPGVHYGNGGGGGGFCAGGGGGMGDRPSVAGSSGSTSGGGAGGYAGGDGGRGGNGGGVYGASTLEPLLGGSGGAGGISDTDYNPNGGGGGGGAGGGAIQISVDGHLFVSGGLHARGGSGGAAWGGGGGGGSGGALLLEAVSVDVSGSLLATGGSGGSGNRRWVPTGATGGSASSASSLGGGGGQAESGGGGGGSGWIFLRSADALTVTGTLAPAAGTACAGSEGM